ncbi:MAG: exodeoxyribonuclease III [Chloroflexi bacterium]|jgi:exodeoxyribonuclease-3|nr:exodeoxyribonuclease III [Anaerolineaceae bacterium]NLI45201.1 exodeoxyribonuclease III [Chloroflexota bacterium]HOE34728.1 exodeoxyribonuclease III [Anaerolineaceae bacterium]HOT25366.1 exodeoxyribonuclease III [Anaerolineaceae bacterium]HQH57327.1 exodeoxyribonuclease III [Anaerolineaceae bacterium]
MKITTWNVNGYRAVLAKQGFDWVKEHQPDILCLQEIKVKPEQLTEDQRELPGYQSFWNPAERPGYSGTAVFYKIAPLEISTGLGVEEFDSEGRVTRLRYPDFLLYNIYFPNGGEENQRVPFKLGFYARLLDVCDEHHEHGENVIITGDFNTAHNEIDLARPKDNEKNTGFLPEERVWIDKFLEHGFIDVYRHLYPLSQGYTWWTYRMNARAKNIGWRLDYFLVSAPLMTRVRDTVILDEIMGSDHCPVTLELN